MMNLFAVAAVNTLVLSGMTFSLAVALGIVFFENGMPAGSQMIMTSIEIAKSLAPEDVQVGDYISVLASTYQFPTFYWCIDSGMEKRNQTVNIEFLTSEAAPLRVKAICLPFVFVMNFDKDHRQVDVRVHRIARVSNEYADTVWKTLREQKK